jgi:hypothetical protein
VYAVSAAILPLTHPIAASALAAQLVALAAARREADLRLAVPAVGIATIETGLLLTAAVLDRRDAPDAAGSLDLGDVGVGVGRAFGWNPAVAALAIWGLVVLYQRSGSTLARWKGFLVAGLAVMPLLAVLVAGIALPVYPRVASTVAAGGIALAAGIGLVAIRDRNLKLAAGAAAAAVAIAALGTAAAADPREDWREAVRIVRLEQEAPDSIVVLPERATSAFAYYAPGVPTTRVGRGDAVTVVVAGNTDLATAVARQVVAPPRYALLEQRDAGRELVVQRWVRP